MLFDEFWLEGELAFLFGDTNVGKSILAVQIANSLSTGTPIDGFSFGSQAQKVLYFDFEQSPKQFEGRYSNNYRNHFSFNENFYRAEINPDFYDPDMDNENGLVTYIRKTLEQFESKALIIDNLTYLKDETEKSKNALPLIKQLKDLKSRFNLSILALAHTPKRDLTRPINKNDLQGSKMLINLCDSAFAIVESTQDKSLRYLKQVKVRSTEMKYDSRNVCLCRITKPENFVQFEHIGHADEHEHLNTQITEIEAKIKKVKELAALGKKQREIAEETGLALGSVNGYLKK